MTFDEYMQKAHADLQRFYDRYRRLHALDPNRYPAEHCDWDSAFAGVLQGSDMEFEQHIQAAMERQVP